MYEQIAANRRRSILLIVSFTLLIGAIGWTFGQIFDFGYAAVVIALVFAVGMSWYSYYYSDKLVLRMSHAKPADPVEHARLINIVEGLAIAGGMPKPKIYVINDPAPNAFATGRNPENAAVAATTGLLERMNRVELEGVMAHELSHVRNHDILVSTIAVVLAGMIVLLSDFMMRAFWFGGGRRRDSDGGAGGPAALIALVGILLAVLAPIIAKVLQLAISRRRELLADSSGIELTRYPPGLISALKKLRDDTTVVKTASRATAHLWIESPLQRKGSGPGSWVNRLFDSHPPLDKRIELLEKI